MRAGWPGISLLLISADLHCKIRPHTALLRQCWPCLRHASILGNQLFSENVVLGPWAGQAWGSRQLTRSHASGRAATRSPLPGVPEHDSRAVPRLPRAPRDSDARVCGAPGPGVEQTVRPARVGRVAGSLGSRGGKK